MLGDPDVHGMLSQMPLNPTKGAPTSLREWQAYFHLDPFGGERGDLQAAMVRQAVVNAFRDPDSDPIQLEDCLPSFGESKVDRARRQKRKQREVPEKVRRVLGRLS